jgi:hypothetical protein
MSVTLTIAALDRVAEYWLALSARSKRCHAPIVAEVLVLFGPVAPVWILATHQVD